MVKHPVPGAAKAKTGKAPAGKLQSGKPASKTGGAKSSTKNAVRPPARKAPPPPAPVPRVDIPPAEVLDARNHFLGTLGQPVHVLDLRGKKPLERLEVAVFEAPQAGAPALLTTCGASVIPGQDGYLFEYVMMLKAPGDKARLQKAAELLAAVAAYPMQQNVKLGPGAVIHSAAQVKAVCGLEALVAFPPLPFGERFSRFTRKDGKKVELLWMVALHESEAAFAEKQGVKRLYEALVAARADLAAVGRPVART
jgi:hypothetical protein